MESSSKKILIIVATFNEAESLPTLLPALLQQLPAANILVIDDNSPDGTGKWAEKFAFDHPRVKVLSRSGKLGLGSAAVTGFQSAIDDGFQWAATLDADLSHDPVSLREMFAMASDGKHDVVIGSRYVAGGKILGWPIHRRITSWLTNIFARFVLGLATKDNTSAMRIYRVAALKQIDLDSIESQGYSYLEEILILLKNVAADVTEFPITFQNREQGKSKANVAEVIGSLNQILRMVFRRSR